jgi:PAS domain S-box-containing protein
MSSGFSVARSLGRWFEHWLHVPHLSRFAIAKRIAALFAKPLPSMLPQGPSEVSDLRQALQQSAADRHRTEQAMQASDEKLRLALDTAKLGTWRWDAGAEEMRWDSRCRAFFGVSSDARVTYEVWAGGIAPEDRARIESNVARAVDPADPNDETLCEYRVRHTDGTERWLYSTGRAFFELDPASPSGRRVLFMAGAIRDVTEVHLAETALRESEERLRVSNEAAGIGTFTIDPKAGCGYYSPELANMVGVSWVRTARIEDAFARVHREDQARVRAQFDAALGGAGAGRIKADFRYVRPGGEIRWMTWAGRVEFHEGPAGKIPYRIVGACVDITERKHQEDQIHLLMREVNHRSKNMLSLVQAIARQTLAADPDDFLDRFGKRVEALAANQDLLVRNAWKGVDLNELVRSQLGHFEDLIGTSIGLRGPPLFVSAPAAQALGMAVHELATNAGKYGALSGANGFVKIDWRVTRDQRNQQMFVMSWRERCAHPITAPSKLGFGSSVISSMAEMNLGAQVELDYPPTGLTWQLSCAAGEVVECGSVPNIASQRSSASGNERTYQRPRVLVVEDEALVAMEIAHALTEAGFDVAGPARNVPAALELLKRQGCDAAVLDINLGRETSEAIAIELTACETPFVTLSGYSSEQHHPVFAGAPALRKPLRLQFLVAEIKKCIGQKHSGPVDRTEASAQ